LKPALATVADYYPLMKDFPLNDLLSATELERIRGAIVAIFAHLKKIRNTKYPIQRALRLVEAISRDLSTQLLKVLSTRRLIHIPFDEFEKVILIFRNIGAYYLTLKSASAQSGTALDSSVINLMSL
jgi:dynein heavy chain 1